MAPVASVDFSVQPYQGTDVVAWVLAASALICLAIRIRDNERGMGWFALSLGSLAVWTLNNERHLPTGPGLDGSPWWFLMCLALGAMGPGLAAYLALSQRATRIAIVSISLPAAAFALLVAYVALTESVVLRIWAHAFTAMSFLALAATSFWAARREPRAGHGILALAFVAVPGFVVVFAASRTDPIALRYWAVLAPVLVGLILPSMSLLRQRRRVEGEVERRSVAESKLVALNDSLELKVAQRTVDLQSLVAGLESFNRSVSHDLRGPLSGIASLATLANDAWARGDDSLARRALPAIIRQADTSTRLVSSLLELARVGDAPMSQEKVDPSRLALDVIETMRIEGAQDLPKFEVRAMPAVFADPDMLRIVLTNLIGNAVKFTQGRADAQVEVFGSGANGSVQVEVRDNGVGFSGGAAASIFAPFKRLHGADFDGHGVGLSIVRRAVERHGGKIWATGRPGAGACFAFTLPRGGVDTA